MPAIPGFFLDIFAKTQLDENSKNFKTQPIFSAKLRIFLRKLSFPATLLSKSETKNSQLFKTQGQICQKLEVFAAKLNFPATPVAAIAANVSKKKA